MWKYYSVACCSNTQGQQNFMHVGCTAADELPIESIWGRIRTNLLPSLMGAPCCYQIGGRRWWDWCPPWREVRTSMRLASRRQRFNEIRSRMMKCSSLTYLLYLRRHEETERVVGVFKKASICRLAVSCLTYLLYLRRHVQQYRRLRSIWHTQPAKKTTCTTGRLFDCLQNI